MNSVEITRRLFSLLYQGQPTFSANLSSRFFGQDEVFEISKSPLEVFAIFKKHWSTWYPDETGPGGRELFALPFVVNVLPGTQFKPTTQKMASKSASIR